MRAIGWMMASYFNPRSLAGATLATSANTISTSLFQSTLPHGSDPSMYQILPLVRYFNPRSLTGATVRHFLFLCPSTDFNPRSLTGATTKPHFALVYRHYFNPRSLAGATSWSSNSNIYKQYFNPRSLAGATAICHGPPEY